MNGRNTIATIFFLPMAVLFVSASVGYAQPQAAFDRGSEQLQQGNITEALDIWYAAYQNGTQVDSRIGFEFIRTVAKHDLYSYYETATSFYYRALVEGSGQQSRVALARVLVADRPVVLLDEPFGALGPALKDEMLDLVKAKLVSAGKTVLMVTHDPADAQRMADMAALVADGTVSPPVATRDLFSNPPPALKAYLG